MKYAILALAGLVAPAIAMPNNYGDKKYEDDKKDSYYKPHGLSAFPFHFTSTYYAKATSDTM